MARTLLDARITTDYGQLDLIWTDDGAFDGDDDRSFRGQVNGLVGAASGEGVYLNLASQAGAPVTILALEHPPASAAASWEDVVEVSIVIPAGARVRWSTWADENGGDLDLPTNTYRARVSARGRDAARDAEDDAAPDSYLVELWPAPAAEDAIVRTGSLDAAYWHREWGTRR